MLLKTLSLVPAVALTAATPLAETPLKAGKNLLRMPIYNKNLIKLATVNDWDMAREAALANGDHFSLWNPRGQSRQVRGRGLEHTQESRPQDHFVPTQVRQKNGHLPLGQAGFLENDRLVGFAKIIDFRIFGVYFERVTNGNKGQRRGRHRLMMRTGSMVTLCGPTLQYLGPTISTGADHERGHIWQRNPGGITRCAYLGGHGHDTDSSETDHFRRPCGQDPRATVYSGKIQLPRSSVLTLQPLTFMIKYKPLTLPPKQYMLTDDEVDVVGGDPNKAHLWIAENTGNFDVTFELKVLGQFYSVHDGDNHCVGLHQ
ncbi:hypothetical protein BGZ92_008878 [Podila epicladia]|nr:hypothetical protein BGZ92_008878 [Podila epicladia]